MINIFVRRNGLIVRESLLLNDTSADILKEQDKILWIDLFHPSTDELTISPKLTTLKSPQKKNEKRLSNPRDIGKIAAVSLLIPTSLSAL